VPWTWGRLLVEPRRPESIRNRPNAHWFAVAAVCVGALMGQLDASIVTVALPTLQKSFHASVGSVTWVGLSYLLVLVATVTAVGRFADMWGRKLLYVYGFVIFILASALCGLAPDLAALCGFRALQASGRPCCRPTAWPSSAWSSRPAPSGGPSGSRERPRPSASRSDHRSEVCCWRRAGGD
jgi:MFS family permease